jgi:hypothetical protein
MTSDGAYDIFVSDLREVLYSTDPNEKLWRDLVQRVTHWQVGMVVLLTPILAEYSRPLLFLRSWSWRLLPPIL